MSCQRRAREETGETYCSSPLPLGNVDEIVITGLWEGITAEEYGGEHERKCVRRGKSR